MVKVFCQYAFLESFANLDLNINKQDSAFLEKYAFIQKLISKEFFLDKEAAFTTQLNQVKALFLKGIRQNEKIDSITRFLFSLRKNAQNPIRSDDGFLREVLQLRLPIELAARPTYLLIIGDQEMCRRVMERYGIVCIGLSQGKICLDARYYAPGFETTPNIFKSFCSILRNAEEYFNRIDVVDQHFFSKRTGVDYACINSSIGYTKPFKLSIHFSDNPKNLQPHQKAKTKSDIESEIKIQCKDLLNRLTLHSNTINKYNFHDRFMVTSTKIFISGNSFSNECETHLNYFPIGLYYENLPENIRKLL